MRCPSTSGSGNPVQSLSAVRTCEPSTSRRGTARIQRHGHINSILGQDTGSIGNGDAALNRGRNVNVVDTVAKIGDEFELFT